MTGAESGGFDDLPPSAKYVYRVLNDEGPLSRKELQGETQLSESTLDDALDTLENCDYLLRTRKSEDLRQVVVKLGTKRRYNPSQK
ncbi:MarR family winged helix-turn-helix transcriptional regulator [Haloarcula sebkhae]|uniref:MarR family transcriptional regulator n=2 Tax=Haloarcula sebkhae TaxID=932660 RepID=A0A830F130_9EURY|nr:MarR family winged helix-turn-helix transcriptional regulator [Haloarcula sebkhae]GGK74640.1 MarR family transcriptional regulator [Haloarcula sebkhae]